VLFDLLQPQHQQFGEFQQALLLFEYWLSAAVVVEAHGLALVAALEVFVTLIPLMFLVLQRYLSKLEQAEVARHGRIHQSLQHPDPQVVFQVF
jgi:hypothetical protein